MADAYKPVSELLLQKIYSNILRKSINDPIKAKEPIWIERNQKFRERCYGELERRGELTCECESEGGCGWPQLCDNCRIREEFKHVRESNDRQVGELPDEREADPAACG